MRKVECSEIVDSYTAIRDWYKDYKRALDFWEELLAVLDSTTEDTYQRVQFVIDSYDVIQFCFPLYEAFTKLSTDLSDETYRKRLFRVHSARACLFYGVPFGRPVLMLQPHYEEVLHFVDHLIHSASTAVAQSDLIRWAGPELDFPAILQALQLLEGSTLDTPLDADRRKALDRLCKDFSDMALLLAGAYKKGLSTLRQLVRGGAFMEEPQWLPRQTFFGDCSKELRSRIEQQPHSDGKGELPPSVGDYREWLEMFDEVRPSYSFSNMRDAEVLAMVREANRQFEEERVLFLFVSSSDLLRSIVEQRYKGREVIRAGAKFGHLFVPTDYFYAYLQFGPTMPSPSKDPDAHTKEDVIAGVRSALADEKETLDFDSFSELEESMNRVLKGCKVNTRQARLQGRLPCIDDCLLRSDKKEGQLRTTLHRMVETKDKTEDSRNLKKRHPILRTFLDGIDADAPTEIDQVLKHLEGGDPWERLLLIRIRDLKEFFSAERGRLYGDIIPFSETLADTYAATFFYFPYRIKFQTQRLQKLSSQLAMSIRKGGADEIQSILQKFSLAAADPEAEKEADLVRAVCLYAFSKGEDILALTSRYMNDEGANPEIVHELRYLRVRTRIEMYRSVQGSDRDPKLLVEAQKDCKQGLESKHEDARYWTALGLALSYLHLEKNILKDRRPMLTDVQEAYEESFKIEEKKCTKDPGRSKDLLWTNMNNLAAVLVRRGPQFLDQAKNYMKGIDLPRKEWIALWIDTLGGIVFKRAKTEESPKLQLKFAEEAVTLFTEALQKVRSANDGKEIQRNLQHAQAFLQQRTKD